MTPRLRLIFFALSFMFFSLFFSLTHGSAALSLSSLFSPNQEAASLIFFKVRIPRTLAAFVSGGLLALSGSFMQLLLQNPLADPYVLGVSGGAAFFTLLAMFFGLGGLWLLGGAWVGSLSAILLILLLARKHRFQSHALLLSGIAIACGFSAAISCILLLSHDQTLHSMLFWLTGDLNGAAFPATGILILSFGLLSSFLLAPGLNVLSRGEKAARALGLATQHYQVWLYLLSSLLTAAAVSLAGCIGFIGLIIPHISRQLCGFDQRIVLPLSVLLGGSLLTVADTLARSLFAPEQLPVGILMALIGVPIFIWLIQK